MKTKFITSKELAAELEMDERTFRMPCKIRELGLDECRDHTSPHRIRFYREKVVRVLARHGHASSF